MTNEKRIDFLERLIAAGENGLENVSMSPEEDQLARELIHDGEAGILEVSEDGTPKRQFLVAAYGAHELLYVARGWAKYTREGLLITEEGHRHLKLALKTDED